jgi:acyl-coenzyme A synthetase/AMP-(fatty) acid ligase/3-hydroxymyristoyl/3-hydroxydecanoyl-(acyl carrier protein) dehydratase
MPLAGPLSRLLEEVGDRPGPIAFGRDGERSGRDFVGDVATLMDRLESVGAGRWLILSEDRYAVAVSLFALAGHGAIGVLPPNLQPETLRRSAAGAAGALCAGREDAAGSSRELGISRLAPLGSDRAEPRAAALRGPTPRAPARLDRSGRWVEFQTSGTTGQGRPIVKALRHLEDEVAVLEARLGSDMPAAARVFATASHQHIYGLLFGVLWPLASGRAFQRESLLHPRELLPRMAACTSAALVTTPVHLKRMVAGAGLRELRGICRCVVSSGGPLDAEVAAAVAEQLGAAPLEVFGSTETGGVAVRRRDEHGEVWQPLPGVEVRASEQAGRLEVISAFASVGSELGDGRTRSLMGDRIELVPGGGFLLLGRADRVVKIAEKRLSLPAMEQILGAHAWVEEAALLVRESAGESRVHAVASLSAAGRSALHRDGRRGVRAELMRQLVASFDPVLLPRAWRLVAALPRDSQDKVPAAALLALFEDRASPVRPAAPRLLSEERRADSLERRLEVPGDLAQLEGHFDALPVVAGVVQLGWVFAAAASWLGRPPAVEGVEALKFPRPLRPGGRVTLQLERTAAGRGFRFSLHDGDAVFASGRVVFRAHADAVAAM